MRGRFITCCLDKAKNLFYKIKGWFIKMPRFECLRCGIAILKANLPLKLGTGYPVCPICRENDQVDIALCYDNKPVDLKTVIYKEE
jgi:hypothetical protein